MPFKQRPVFEDDTHIPYAERSISAVMWLVLAIFLVGGFTAWFFLGFGSGEQSQKQNAGTQYSSENGANISAENSVNIEAETQTPGKGKSALYRFFKEVFSGVGDGVESSSLNAYSSPSVSKMIDAQDTLRRQAEALSSIDDGYRHSIHDVIGSNVVTMSNKKAGTIYDIFVHKKTGVAEMMIIDGNENQSSIDLKNLEFDKVFVQTEDGATQITMEESTLDRENDFEYNKENHPNLISLRRLHNGQLLDFEDNIVGQIDAILYGNAEAQGLALNLKPSLRGIKSDVFYLPFEAAHFVENPDGLDIKLTEEQTRSLAKWLFDNQGKQEKQEK